MLSGATHTCAQDVSTPQASIADKPWPTRLLGRTGVELTTLTLGTAPCGLSPKIPPVEIARIVNEAIDLGVNSIDTAPAYVQSEEGIGLALGARRTEVFLATKVMPDTIAEAERSLSRSLELAKTDWFDLVYFHNAGDRDVEAATGPEGVFSWLIKQKQAGGFRYLGVSGHNRPARLVRLLETGEVDVLLTVVNFVDRFTYGFDHQVLPVARNRNVGIVAMKVFGGARQSAGGYENPDAPPEMDVQHLELAVRHALGIPGVATVNLGVQNRDHLRRIVQLFNAFYTL
jgi:predicted aldo/keto reductase-like oxidoreductase